jgi:ribulose kinase
MAECAAEAPSWGSAILAAAEAKVYPSVPAAAQNMLTVERTIQRDPARHEE